MRAIQFVTELIDRGQIVDRKMKRMLVHAIAGDDVMLPLGANSKLNADRAFLIHLRDAGRRHAAEWLERGFANVGERSGVDIRGSYL